MSTTMSSARPEGRYRVLGLARGDEGEVHAPQDAAGGDAVVGLGEGQPEADGTAEHVGAVPLGEPAAGVAVRNQVDGRSCRGRRSSRDLHHPTVSAGLGRQLGEAGISGRLRARAGRRARATGVARTGSQPRRPSRRRGSCTMATPSTSAQVDRGRQVRPPRAGARRPPRRPPRRSGSTTGNSGRGGAGHPEGLGHGHELTGPARLLVSGRNTPRAPRRSRAPYGNRSSARRAQ